MVICLGFWEWRRVLYIHLNTSVLSWLRSGLLIVNEKQLFSTQSILVPSVFVSPQTDSKSLCVEKAVVFLASPFGRIKDEITSFLHNIQQRHVTFYFSADSEFCVQVNLQEKEASIFSSQILFPLNYVNELLSRELGDTSYSIQAYSFSLNVIPLLSSLFCSFLSPRSLHTNQYLTVYRSSLDIDWLLCLVTICCFWILPIWFLFLEWTTVETMTVAILRMLHMLGLDVTDYIFYLGYSLK